MKGGVSMDEIVFSLFLSLFLSLSLSLLNAKVVVTDLSDSGILGGNALCCCCCCCCCCCYKLEVLIGSLHSCVA